LSPQAELDLLETWSFVAADVGEQRADSLVDALTDACWMLSEYPKVGRLRPEFGSTIRPFPLRPRHAVTAFRVRAPGRRR